MIHYFGNFTSVFAHFVSVSCQFVSVFCHFASFVGHLCQFLFMFGQCGCIVNDLHSFVAVCMSVWSLCIYF